MPGIFEQWVRSWRKQSGQQPPHEPIGKLHDILSGQPLGELRSAYKHVHGSWGEGGIPPGPATAWPDQPYEHSGRAMDLVGQMYPNPPRIVPPEPGTPFGAAYHRDGTVFADPDITSPGTFAHEFEHSRQGRQWWGERPIAGAIAREFPATVLGNLMPQASWQSGTPIHRLNQRQDLIADLTPDYKPTMTWLHNQAQRHGVFGPTQLAKSLGFQGDSPQSITQLMADNPQWFANALNIPYTQPSTPRPPRPSKRRPQDFQLGSPRPPAFKPYGSAPDLTGYLD